MKKFIILTIALFAMTNIQAQTPEEILDVTRRVNDYFMKKYSDPTVPTNVGKIRPSSLWTRAVYYEGLMELYKVDAQQRYIDYTDRWAEFHKWTPRNGITTCDADDQCCEQTYLDRYMMTKQEKMIVHVKENLAHQMKTGNERKANGALYGWWTWIDAIQMNRNTSTTLCECTPGVATHWLVDCSTRRKASGGAMPTMCLPTKRRTDRTATGAAVPDGCMLP